jgi:hypothetical protein
MASRPDYNKDFLKHDLKAETLQAEIMSIGR